MPSVMMMTSIVSGESLARDTPQHVGKKNFGEDD